MSKQYLILAKCYDKRQKLISLAFNSYTKSHPVQRKFAQKAGRPEKIYLHAEILAIIRAKGKEIDWIHIERYNQHGQTMLAAPCPICLEAIKEAKIKKVTFST